MRKIGLVAGEFIFNVEETCTIRMDGSVSQGTGGERKGSGSAAGTGESSEGEGEEGTGGETKGTRGKKETGEWMSVSAMVTLLSALGFKWIFFFLSGGTAATGRGAESCKRKRSCQTERSCC